MVTQDSFVVVTQLTYEPEMKEQVLQLLYDSFPIYKSQEGLVAITMHHHEHEPKVMTYFVWEAEEDYMNCMNGADFALTQFAWKDLIKTGKARFESNTYTVIDTFAKHLSSIF
jgi:hypothetical protein